MRSARASGFNTLLVQVRGRGDAYFADGLEPRADGLAAQRADFDPLQTVITSARAEGLRVHAWVNVNLVASAAELPAGRGHIVYRHPEWLMVPRPLAVELARADVRSPEFLGRLARWTRAADDVEGLFISPVPARGRRAPRRASSTTSSRATPSTACTWITSAIRVRSSTTTWLALQAFRQDLEPRCAGGRAASVRSRQYRRR